VLFEVNLSKDCEEMGLWQEPVDRTCCSRVIDNFGFWLCGYHGWTVVLVSY
jgi:hypothetical protein